MKWAIDFTHDAEKFLERDRIDREEIFRMLQGAVQKFKGEEVNINIRKLKGRWLGFYRVKRGDLRIIASFDFDRLRIFIDQIDWRGNAYKE